MTRCYENETEKRCSLSRKCEIRKEFGGVLAFIHPRFFGLKKKINCIVVKN